MSRPVERAGGLTRRNLPGLEGARVTMHPRPRAPLPENLVGLPGTCPRLAQPHEKHAHACPLFPPRDTKSTRQST